MNMNMNTYQDISLTLVQNMLRDMLLQLPYVSKKNKHNLQQQQCQYQSHVHPHLSYYLTYDPTMTVNNQHQSETKYDPIIHHWSFPCVRTEK
jgi:hypothetical protein